MLKQAILSGEYNERFTMETFLCFKRAVNAIISTFILDMAKILKKGC